jgi:hypothetical protein
MDLRTRRFLMNDMRQSELAKRARVLQSRLSLAERFHIQLRDDEKERIEEVVGVVDWEEPHDA